MTKANKLKRAARERSRKTGETYATSRRQILQTRARKTAARKAAESGAALGAARSTPCAATCGASPQTSRPMPPRPTLIRRLGRRLVTAGQLLVFFAKRHGYFFVPLVLVLLAAGALLALTGGLSYVAPFIYTAF